MFASSSLSEEGNKVGVASPTYAVKISRTRRNHRRETNGLVETLKIGESDAPKQNSGCT